jgi:hypothetical protein
MSEVQKHGFWFQDWVTTTFFPGYESPYGAKWDIPAEENTTHGRIPISIKTAKYPSPIGLGDAVRQFIIDEDFMLAVAFWRQTGNLKKVVNVSVACVKRELWRSLWHPVTLKALQDLDAIIKDMSQHYSEVRKTAQREKAKYPFTECSVTLNPKIDSKSQRRLQCSIPFRCFFERVAPNCLQEEVPQPELWGRTVPREIASPPRRFRSKRKETAA